jgi:NAD(P)-dependent dehydrogenase (short-subunit alcohol dehydrogenase family)
MGTRFAGKVAVVTGAGNGIGRATAHLLAQEGAKVVVNDLGGSVYGKGRDGGVAQKVVDEIKALGGEAVAETSDISTMQGGKAVTEAALDSFGRIDILVHNAGIIRLARIDQMSEEEWDQVIAVHLKGSFTTVRNAAPHMVKQRGGAIVCISSPSGFGHAEMANYTAAKEGIVGFTRTVARDLGPFNIRCNAVRPVAASPRMETPEILEGLRHSVEDLGLPPLGIQWLPSVSGGDTVSLPENVAAVVAWLCSDATSAVNGREYYIAGGHVALCQEPELVRARFNSKGWDFESLVSPQATNQLTFGLTNYFAKESN